MHSNPTLPSSGYLGTIFQHLEHTVDWCTMNNEFTVQINISILYSGIMSEMTMEISCVLFVCLFDFHLKLERLFFLFRNLKY